MRSVVTRTGVYVAARAGTVRRACRVVRGRGRRLGSLASLLAGRVDNPWAEALTERRP